MKIVATEKAPAALGPYSQGYIHGGMFYSAGQLGADPATGNLAEGIEGQADRACQNMAAVLEAAGTSFDKVVKTTCFLADMAYSFLCQPNSGEGITETAQLMEMEELHGEEMPPQIPASGNRGR